MFFTATQTLIQAPNPLGIPLHPLNGIQVCQKMPHLSLCYIWILRGITQVPMGNKAITNHTGCMEIMILWNCLRAMDADIRFIL
ncbi:hypothetical protein A2303_04135 [Candidatus Falkowbacteria bacterium RIFOXYB2_FULL_47_14]|nr:MAG: hypothetical protein A2303_04135 [Candidatus Falkowbacteria bacterium RIFOXYB2_FULL_47_14]